MKKYDHFVYPPIARLPSFDNITPPQTPYNYLNQPSPIHKQNPFPPAYNFYDYYGYNQYNPYYTNPFQSTSGFKKYIPIIKKVVRYITPILAIVLSVITGFIII